MQLDRHLPPSTTLRDVSYASSRCLGDVCTTTCSIPLSFSPFPSCQEHKLHRVRAAFVSSKDMSRSYFEAFRSFSPDSGVSVEADFRRLAESKGWSEGQKIWRAEWRRCLSSEFEVHVAMMVVDDKLSGWQALCREVGMQRIPESINECKKVRKSSATYISLFRGLRKLTL